LQSKKKNAVLSASLSNLREVVGREYKGSDGKATIGGDAVAAAVGKVYNKILFCGDITRWRDAEKICFFPFGNILEISV